jgi:hypothetical protein
VYVAISTFFLSFLFPYVFLIRFMHIDGQKKKDRQYDGQKKKNPKQIYKTLHRKLILERNEPHKKNEGGIT